jgi:hypothetical protein
MAEQEPAEYCVSPKHMFRRISYSLVGKDGNIEYTPSSSIFHSARNNLRRCFPACTVCMQVFNIAELNISVKKKK